MKKAIWWVVGIIIVVVLIVVVINSNSSNSGPIKIGLIAPLTGDGAPYGDSLKGAADLALKEINSVGGINGRQVQFITEDSKCTGKDAATAAQKLISIDKVKYIIGLPCSGEVLGVLPISDPAKVILMVQGSNPAITATGHYVFRTFPNDLLSSQTIAKHAINNGFKTAAVITENTDYSVGMEKAFTDAYESLGGNVADSEKYQSDATDFRSILTKIKALSPAMIFINAQVGANAARIAEQARQLGIKSQFYTAFFSGDDFVKSSPAVNGTYVVDLPVLNSSSTEAVAFSSAYRAANGGDPAYPFFAAGAYDETNILAQALKNVGTDDTDTVWNYLHGLHSYTGVVGTFHFDNKGDVVGVLPLMKKVVNNTIITVN